MNNEPDYKAAYAEIEACINDSEDGAGYLFDAMKGATGETIKRALLIAHAVTQEPSEDVLKAVPHIGSWKPGEMRHNSIVFKAMIAKMIEGIDHGK